MSTDAPPVVLVQPRGPTLTQNLACRGADAYVFEADRAESDEAAAAVLARAVESLAQRSDYRPIRLIADGVRGHVVAHLASSELPEIPLEIIELRPDSLAQQDAIDDALAELNDLDHLPPPPERLPRQGARTERHRILRTVAHVRLEAVGLPALKPFVILETGLREGGHAIAAAGDAIPLARIRGATERPSDRCSDPYLVTSGLFSLDGRPVVAESLGFAPCGLGRIYTGEPDRLAVGKLGRAEALRMHPSELAFFAKNPFATERHLRKQQLAVAQDVLQNTATIRRLLRQGRVADAARVLADLAGVPEDQAHAFFHDLADGRPNPLEARVSHQLLYAWRALLVPPERPRPVSLHRGPIPQDATLPIAEMHLAGYRRPTEMAFTRDLLEIAAIEDFTIVVYAPAGQDPNALTRQIIADTDVDEDWLKDHLEVRVLDVGIEEFHAYAEDPQIATWNDRTGGFELIGVPKLQARTLRTFSRLIESEPYYRALSQAQGVASEFSDEAESLARASRRSSRARVSARRGRTYLEGGNVVTGTRKNGEPYAIVGEDSVLLSRLHLEDQGAFEAALDLEARTELTRSAIAEDLALDRSAVTFIEQPAFHTDLALTPLGEGELAIGSHRAAEEILSRVMIRTDLRPADHLTLTAMRLENARRKETLQPVLDRIAAALTDELGLEVVELPAPLSTGDLSTAHPCVKTPRTDVNFMNAVPGLGRDGKRFYITGGTAIGALRDEFRTMVVSNPALDVARVYFVGNGRPGPEFHSFAAESVMRGGGLRCAQFHLPFVQVSKPSDLHARRGALR